MPEIPLPISVVTRYEVSCLPESYPDRKHFAITVQRVRTAAGTPGWVVTDGELYWATDGRLSESRQIFTGADEALAVAKQAAPTLVVNGETVAAALARGPR